MDCDNCEVLRKENRALQAALETARVGTDTAAQRYRQAADKLATHRSLDEALEVARSAFEGATSKIAEYEARRAAEAEAGLEPEA